jgi:hypothetical protein
VDEGFLIPTALTAPILIENAVYYSPKQWFGGEKHMRTTVSSKLTRARCVLLNLRVCATTANNITFCFVTKNSTRGCVDAFILRCTAQLSSVQRR